MSRAYIRYTREQDKLNTARGLFLTALKKKAEPRDYRYRAGAVLPNDYRYCYRPEDFFEMDVVLENQAGNTANLRDLRHLLPSEMFDGRLDWVLAGVVFTGDHLELYHVGFDTPRVIAESVAFVLMDSRPSWAQTRCHGVCGAEVRIGRERFVVRFDVDGGGISGLPEEYAEISTVVSEYRESDLICDYFVPVDKPIIVHQYLPEK